MRRVSMFLASVVLGAGLLAGCVRTDPQPSASPSTSSDASPTEPGNSTPAVTTSPSPSDLASPTTPSSPLPAGFSTAAKGGGAMITPASLLTVIRAAEQPGYERVVFEFDGLAPAYDVRYVDQVDEDPSGNPVTLDGSAFLLVAMPGGTLDTAFQESDPANARSYTGPRQIHPDLRQVKEIAVAGDFEAVLSFGIGLEHTAPFRVLRLADPGRIVVDVATA